MFFLRSSFELAGERRLFQAALNPFALKAKRFQELCVFNGLRKTGMKAGAVPNLRSWQFGRFPASGPV
jgi:hypothetical protein